MHLDRSGNSCLNPRSNHERRDLLKKFLAFAGLVALAFSATAATANDNDLQLGKQHSTAVLGTGPPAITIAETAGYDLDDTTALSTAIATLPDQSDSLGQLAAGTADQPNARPTANNVARGPTSANTYCDDDFDKTVDLAATDLGAHRAVTKPQEKTSAQVETS